MSSQRQNTPGMLTTFAFCGIIAAAGASVYLTMWRYERDDSYLSFGLVLAVSSALWLTGVWRWGRKVAQSAARRSEDLLGARAHVWARRGPDRRMSAREPV